MNPQKNTSDSGTPNEKYPSVVVGTGSFWPQYCSWGVPPRSQPASPYPRAWSLRYGLRSLLSSGLGRRQGPAHHSRIIILLLLWSILWTSPATAQSDLSLPQLIQQALATNYQLQILRNNEQMATNRNTRGMAGMLPTVDLTAEQRIAINNSQQSFFTGDSQEANNARRNSFSANLGVNWVVFDGLAMFARKEQFEQLTLISQADTRFLLDQTVADLAIAYYRLRQESELLGVLRESLDVSRTRLQFEERALEIGASTRLDVQQARVDMHTDSSLVLRQEALLQELTISLNRLLQREMTTSLQPTDSLVLSPPQPLDQLLDEARLQNAQLKRQQLEELIALSEMDIRKGALLPEVSLFGNYGFDRQSNEVGFLQSSRTFGPDFGISVRFNLFNGEQARVARQNAMIERENAQLRTQDLALEVEESLRLAHLRQQAQLQQAALEAQSVAAAREALAIARRQYELGSLTNVAFRTIQLNLIQAESRLLQAQLSAKQRELELLRLTGRVVETLL